MVLIGLMDGVGVTEHLFWDTCTSCVWAGGRRLEICNLQLVARPLVEELSLFKVVLVVVVYESYIPVHMYIIV